MPFEAMTSDGTTKRQKQRRIDFYAQHGVTVVAFLPFWQLVHQGCSLHSTEVPSML
jgi:hypothetical protein